MPADGRGLRLAGAAAVAAAVVVWNAVFDRTIDAGVEEYLQRQQERASSNAPLIPIQDVMEPAARGGARRATLVSVPLAAAGFAGVAWSVRRSRRRPLRQP